MKSIPKPIEKFKHKNFYAKLFQYIFLPNSNENTQKEEMRNKLFSLLHYEMYFVDNEFINIYLYEISNNSMQVIVRLAYSKFH